MIVVERITPQRSPTLDRLSCLLPNTLTAYIHDNSVQQQWGFVPANHNHFFVNRDLTVSFAQILAVALRQLDVVVVMGYRGWFRQAVLLACRVSRTPVVLRSDTNQLSIDGESRKKRIARRAILKLLVPRGATAWTIGEQNERFWRDEIGIRRRVRIPYEVPVLPGWIPADSFRESRSSKPDSIHVLYVGRLSHEKRVIDLVRAFRELTGGRFSAWSLTICGDGPERPLLETAAALDPRIRFVGSVGFGDLHHCFQKADVLVLPSLMEAWGLVVNEALAFGLRVLSSDRVGSSFDLITPELGDVFPACDVEALRAALANCQIHLRQRPRYPLTDTALLMRGDLMTVSERRPRVHQLNLLRSFFRSGTLPNSGRSPGSR